MLSRASLLLALAASSTTLRAEVTLLTQQRAVSALSTFDNQSQTAAAVAFEPFAATVATESPFPTVGGGTGANEAVASINCLVDPNAIRASGSLAAAGGLALVGTQPSPVFGEAAATVIVSFQVDVPTVFRLTAAPRPSTNPRDEFEIELSNLNDDVELFAINENDPPQAVDTGGVLQPGRYEIEYQVELTGDDAMADAAYGFNFTLSSPCGFADVGRAGGLEGADNRLDNNDFIVFINQFFALSSSADVGVAGGLAGSDGAWDNNDFVAFIGAFFNGGDCL